MVTYVVDEKTEVQADYFVVGDNDIFFYRFEDDTDEDILVAWFDRSLVSRIVEKS